MGVKSAWIIIPSLKAVKILLAANIEIEIKEIFANMV